jgi:acyl-coenzyme A thioesterase PaaI-like protein
MALFKETALLRMFAFAKIPLIYWTNPKVMKLTEEECVIAIPNSRRNRNHLGSMYFGALCIGADCAGGLIAMNLIRRIKGGKGSMVFKDFQAKFLKRPEGETHFTCRDGLKVKEAIVRAQESGERAELPVHVIATVPSVSKDEPVAEFILTISLKVKRA